MMATKEKINSTLRRRIALPAVLALLMVTLIAGICAWHNSNSTATDPQSEKSTNGLVARESLAGVFSDMASSETRAASLARVVTEGTVSVVRPLAATVPQAGEGNTKSFPLLIILGGSGVLGIAAVTIWSRRTRLAYLSTALVLVSLSLSLPSPAMAGSGTLTRWILPHTMGDSAYAPLLDQPNGVIYFAEALPLYSYVGGAVPSSGRIGQINLTSNNLVEWPTTGIPGGSMVLESGNIFFTEPASSIIGKLDPSTDTFTRWQLPSAGGDAIIFWVESGNVWYLSLTAAKIGRLTPATNEIQEWALASIGTTVRFYGRASGYMWFSLPNEAKIGRLNTTTDQVTLWTMPTEKVTVLAVGGNTVWFSGAKDLVNPANSLYSTIHLGRLDSGTNAVTRWTVVPTDTPGELAFDPGVHIYDGQFPFEGQVTTGVYKQMAFLDSSARPWVLAARGLTRLDPATNQLLEYSWEVTKLLDINSSGVISAFQRGNTSGFGPYVDTVTYFDTTTSSETRFALPYPTHLGVLQGVKTRGSLRISATEFWFTRDPTWPTLGLSIIERVVITP